MTLDSLHVDHQINPQIRLPMAGVPLVSESLFRIDKHLLCSRDLGACGRGIAEAYKPLYMW